MTRLLVLLPWLLAHLSPAFACTNLLIPGGSNTDGSTVIAYNADSSMQVGGLPHWPAGVHAPGELRATYDWDTGRYLGAIPQPAETYNVVGCTNEHQLTITETTFGGLAILDGSGGRAVCDPTYGCLDYAQTIWTTLARARNAREAITVVDSLMQTYGWASTGESFSIADPQEVWVMEIIGKGNLSKGAVWVATRIPDGTVCAHANQARTREFLVEDPKNFLYSSDVVDFARELVIFEGDDHSFSFSDVYDPVTPTGARYCEARVYSFFASVAAPEANIHSYLDYVQGRNLSNRMPLYVPVKDRVSVNDTMWHMRNHYEGTWFDSTSDIGAGEWRSPLRLGQDGQSWHQDGKTYTNERPISVPYTHLTYVAVQRPQHPFGVVWFGVDDSAFAVRAPFYGVASRVPRSWDDADCVQRDSCREALGLPGTMQKFSFQSMFWVCSLVANYAYTRYDQIAPQVYRRIAETESRLQAALEEQDRAIQELSRNGRTAAMTEAATSFSFREAERLHQEWLDFYGELFATFVDGYQMQSLAGSTAKDDGSFGFQKQHFGFRELFRTNIAGTTGDRYELQVKKWAATASMSGNGANLAAVPKDKRCLKAFGGVAGQCPDVQFESSHFDPGARIVEASIVAYVAVAGLIFGAMMGVLAYRLGRHTRTGREVYMMLD